jgi:hypothetical protein
MFNEEAAEAAFDKAVRRSLYLRMMNSMQREHHKLTFIEGWKAAHVHIAKSIQRGED